MRTLACPAQLPAAVLSSCVNGVSDPQLAFRLAAIAPILHAAASIYDQHAKASSLHLIPRVANVGTVTRDELKKLYADQMSSASGAARPIYNAIRNAPAHGKCPLCGIGNVTVLDHHLPQSKYPDLAVCPFNLVPACDFCNNSKRARFPLTAGQQTLHPYYDDYTQEQWIFACLDTSGSPVLIFSVTAPEHWHPIARERAHTHFDVVKLGHSYTSNANDDLICLKGHLQTIRLTKGKAGVQAYLDDEKLRYSERLNSWQHVMYQTLAQNDWFVDGGYTQIGSSAA